MDGGKQQKMHERETSPMRGQKHSIHVAVILPAKEPDQRLLALVTELRQAGVRHMVVVDDGSTPACQALFAAVGSLDGVAVLRHGRNLGKGRALKTAFAHVRASLPGVRGVVTADADGQHLPEDILRVADRLAARMEGPVLGVRQFGAGVPLRSRVGNLLTRRVFTLLAGHAVSDTQTGLRGLPVSLLPELIALPGERYEYETGMLAHLCQSGSPPVEVPIETVYLDGNRGSHFHPLWDSLRVYRSLAQSGLRHWRLRTGKAAEAGKHDERRWHAA